MANGVELATAYVSLTVDGSQVNQGVRKGLSSVPAQADRVGRDSGRRMGDRMSKGIVSSVGKIAGPLAAIFATVGIGKFISGTVDEAREAQKVAAVTDAIVKSTGGVARVTAKHVGDLSTAISNKIGVDDEAVQTSANLLLTFKNVRNEVGKNNKVFDTAVGLAQDLSKAGFGSAEGAAKMLGKALNDPVKGMTALGRAGVTFTDEQKKQVKEAVKNNDLLKAQRIILGEVKSQVGGVAEATATTGQKVGVAFGNLKERIGTALLPMLDRLGNWFLEKGLPAIQKFGGWVSEKLWPALKDGWNEIQPALQSAQRTILAAFGDGSNEGGYAVKDFATFVTDKLIPGMTTFATYVLPQVANGIAAVIVVVETLWGAFQFLMDVIKRAGNVVLTVFSSVTDTVATLLEALSNVPGFGWAKDAAAKLRTAADSADALKDAINRIEDKRVTVTISAAYENFRQGERDSLPRREHGGPVRAGQPYVVGEKRPELFVPNQSGKIVPRVPGAGGSGGIDYFRLAGAVASEMRHLSLAVDTRQNVVESARYANGRGQL